MKYAPIVSALAILAVAVPLVGVAQEAPRPLSLEEAQRLALEHNPAYRRVQAELTTAESQLRRARGAMLPELALSFGSTGTVHRTFTAPDPFGGTLKRDDPVIGRNSFSSQSLSFGTVTLFDGGQRRADVHAARAGLATGEARVEAEALRLAAEVRRRYYATVQAERAIRLEEELLAGARERLEATQRLLRVGVRGPVDVLGAEVKVAEQEQALERARGEHRKAELALREQIGRMDGGPLHLGDDPAPRFSPAPLDLEALVATASSDHPRITRVLAAERQAGMGVRAAGGARLPRLTMSPSLGRSQRFDGFGGLYEANPLDQALGLSFNLSLPVFTGHRIGHGIQQARSAQTAAGEDVRAERLALEREVRGAFIDLENAYRAAGLAERTRDLSRERLAMAQEQYRIGALTLPELHDAVEGAARAERDALRARFEFGDALATLEERVGVPLTPAGDRP
jgi:outer membrane protein